jgi:elongation factor G
VSLAVEARGVEDRERLPAALEKLQWEDPTFRVHEDAETGQTILTGMGELHLEIVTDRLTREFGVGVKTGRPQVVYRETLGKSLERRESFRLEAEGKLLAGEVLLRLTPLQRGSGLKIALPEVMPPPLTADLGRMLRETLEMVCSAGCRTGYPLTDLEVRVAEIPFEAGVTSDAGICAAARRGLIMAARDAAPLLLEPIMELEITMPQEAAGKVIGGLQQKRGRVEGMDNQGPVQVVRALVPLAAMFGYMTELRSATRGSGTFTMEFSRFEPAPAEVQRQFGL